MYLAALYTLFRQTTTATTVAAVGLVLALAAWWIVGMDTPAYLASIGMVTVGLVAIVVRALMLPIATLLPPPALFRHLADATWGSLTVSLFALAVAPNLLAWTIPLIVFSAASWLVSATWIRPAPTASA